MKILEMNRGIGWDRAARDAEIDNNGRDRRPGSGVAELATRTAETPGIGYENVEWLVVDEADILFGAYYHIQRSPILTMPRPRLPGVHPPPYG